MSIFGGGLLVGAAIIVIIPEGIKVLIKSYKHNHLDDDGHGHIEPSEFLTQSDVIDTNGLGNCIGQSMAFGFAIMLIFDEMCKKKKSDKKEASVNVTTVGLCVHSLSCGSALGISLFFSMLCGKE